MAVDDVYTKLLLHMEGVDNGTTFVDEAGHTATAHGAICTKTNIKKFGSASAYCDGTDDSVDIPTSEDFNFGAGDFTVEGWFYFLSNNKGYQILIDRRGASDSTGWLMYLEGDNKLSFLSAVSGGWSNLALHEISVPEINTWIHLAVVRYGNVWTFYKNGVNIRQATVDQGIGAQAVPLTIGRSHVQYGWDFYGCMDEVKISKGIARWVANFTPPTSAYASARKPSGSAVFGPFVLPAFTDDPADSAINWTEDIPASTSLIIKTAIVLDLPTIEDYSVAINGGTIPNLVGADAGKNLYILAELATTDINFTPSLLSLYYRVLDVAGQDTLRIILTDPGRIKYPIGEVSLAYNKAVGNLLGLRGGQVEDFLQTLSAINITKVFNPNDVEHLTPIISMTVSSFDVIYREGQAGIENMAALIGMAIVVTKVGDQPL